jgi:hypothetical protein
LHGRVTFVTGKRRRLFVGLILTMFVAPLSVRGQCFMPAVPTSGSSGASGASGASEHNCCKQGLQALPPACCMTSLAGEAPARIAKAYRPSVPTIAVGVLALRPVAGGTLPERRLLRSHGDPHLADPPPRVLRI